MILLLYKLVIIHFLLDFPLQGDFLARAKNHKTPIDGAPWWLCLAAHAIIQGGGVYFVTGNWGLGMLETTLHAVTDYMKNEGWLGEGERGFVIDQFLHILCKVILISLPR